MLTKRVVNCWLGQKKKCPNCSKDLRRTTIWVTQKLILTEIWAEIIFLSEQLNLSYQYVGSNKVNSNVTILTKWNL